MSRSQTEAGLEVGVLVPNLRAFVPLLKFCLRLPSAARPWATSVRVQVRALSAACDLEHRSEARALESAHQGPLHPAEAWVCHPLHTSTASWK